MHNRIYKYKFKLPEDMNHFYPTGLPRERKQPDKNPYMLFYRWCLDNISVDKELINLLYDGQDILEVFQMDNTKVSVAEVDDKALRDLTDKWANKERKVPKRRLAKEMMFFHMNYSPVVAEVEPGYAYIESEFLIKRNKNGKEI